MGDQWYMSVNVSNTTSKKVSGKLKVKTEGPLKVVTGSESSIEIEPNSESEVRFLVKADNIMAVAKIRAEFEALKETFVEETEISIRPAATLTKTYKSGIIDAGKQETLTFGSNYLPKTDQHKVFISNSPLTQFTEDIDKLIGYPFGCVEQTVSKAFPQLYFEDLVSVLYEGQDKTVNKNDIKTKCTSRY